MTYSANADIIQEDATLCTHFGYCEPWKGCHLWASSTLSNINADIWDIVKIAGRYLQSFMDKNRITVKSRQNSSKLQSACE